MKRFVVALLALSVFPIHSIHAAGRQFVHGKPPDIVANLPPASRLPAGKHLKLAITLPLRNQSALTNLLQQLYDPASPNFRRFLTPAQFAERFGPTTNDYRAVIDYAKSNHLAVVATHPNRTMIEIDGAVADIERALKVNLRLYRHPKEPRDFYAPDAAPSLDLSIPVLAIDNLDDFYLPRPMGIVTNFLNSPGNATPNTTGSGPRGNFIGNDFRAAYAPDVSLNGAGESIGLIEFDNYYANDITTYCNLAGIPIVPLTKIFVNSGDFQPGGNNIEVALDIEMSMAMAPALSNVFVYVGSEGNALLNRMATDNLARQLSSSWEFGSAVDPTRDQIFMQFAAQGQSCFQSSGDLGTWTHGAFAPSDNPYVTIVGGTSLTTTNPGKTWLSETTWPGSGGGISTVYPIPSWQQSIDFSINLGSSTMRNIPDVSCVADNVIWIVANNGEQATVGGTSAATPLWAGFMALANQKAAAQKQSPIGFLNPALYSIGQGSNYSHAFHDITTGNNTNSASSNRFFAVPGFDLCTGWGTPNGNALIDALEPSDALVIAPAGDVIFSGPPGGPFVPASQSYSLTNAGTVSLSWASSNAAPWLNLSIAGGTLVSAGPATSAGITLSPAANALTAGAYNTRIYFTNLTSGIVQQRNVILNVNVSPVITTQPSNQIVLKGMPATFAINTSNNGSLSYQWRHDNGVSLTNVTDGGEIFGAATPVLTINNVQSANTGTYSVMVSNSAGSLISSNALLSIVSGAGPDVASSVLYSFPGGNPGGYPNGLAQSATGDLFGTTLSGGTNDAGTVFKLATNGLFTSLRSFNGSSDGANPFAALVVGPDANLYGSTFHGGASGNGTLFQVTTGGLLSTLVSFNITNGDFPYARLTSGIGTDFYGASYQGGTYGRGTAFHISTNGALSTLYSFSNGSDGGHVSGALVRGSDGKLYGTTFKGGTQGFGTVFQLGTNGALNTLFSFNSTNGAFPFAGLSQATDGSFYGVTTRGGISNCGTIFRITASGDMTNLFSFTGGNDGANPRAELLAGVDGNFYGTTTEGGVYGKGTVFVVTPGGALFPLIQFDGFNGANPDAALVQSPAGIIYGTTRRGGSNSVGTVFQLSIASGLQITAQPAGRSVFAGDNVSFSVSVLGQAPFIYQWQKDGTNLSSGGNISGSQSRVLSLTGVSVSDGGNYSVIVSNLAGSMTSTVAPLVVTSTAPYIVLQPTNQTLLPGATATFDVSAFGNLPLSFRWRKNGINIVDSAGISGSQTPVLVINSVTEGSNGTYSVTVSNSLGGVTSSNALLTVIPVSAPGTRLATLHSFGGDLDTGPPNELVVANNGILYGTIFFGGTFHAGAAFSLTPEGVYTTVASFRSTNGALPESALIQSRTGLFYGTTVQGGAMGYGSVFQMTDSGVLSNVYSFNSDTDGFSPSAALKENSDGNFYGTTGQGGDFQSGNVFQLTPAGEFTNLYSFTGAEDGTGPQAAVIIGSDGNLYGTAGGGLYAYGTVYKLTPAGTLTTLYAFTGGPDGGSPSGTLVQGTDGNIYGVTATSSTNIGGMTFDSNGTLFRITTNGALTTIHRFNFIDGARPEAGMIQSRDGNFYGVTFYGGTNNGNGSLFQLSPGGVLTTLVSFDAFNTGAHPRYALVEGLDGSLYGTTSTGGPGTRGTVFRLTFTNAPQITSQLSNRLVALGSAAVFDVAAFGAPTLSYQWRRNGTNLTNGGNISGATTRILTIASASMADAGSYSVIVSNNLDFVTSSNAVLTVVPQPIFQTVSQADGFISLTWSTVIGQQYQLQFNPDLLSGAWLNLGSPLAATNGFVTVSNLVAYEPKQFYRVVVVP